MGMGVRVRSGWQGAAPVHAATAAARQVHAAGVKEVLQLLPTVKHTHKSTSILFSLPAAVKMSFLKIKSLLSVFYIF